MVGGVLFFFFEDSNPLKLVYQVFWNFLLTSIPLLSTQNGTMVDSGESKAFGCK